MRRKREEKEFFQRQIQLLYPELYSEARAHTPSDQEAEDLVQTTCKKAWESLDALKDRQTFRSWVKGIHRHVIADYFRAKYKEQGMMYFTDDPVEEIQKQMNGKAITTEGAIDEILEALIDRENRIVLMKAFRQLSGKHQAILKMWLLSEYNQREIAEITGMNYNTLRTEIRRALIKLTALFHEIDGGYEDE